MRSQKDPSTWPLNYLLSDLSPLRDKVKELHGRVTVEGYVENEGDVVVTSGLAEDIRDVLLEYRVSTQKVDTVVVSLKPWFSNRWHNNRRYMTRIVG